MDSLGHTMLSVVTDGAFDWGDDRAPDLAYHTPSATRRTSRASPSGTLVLIRQ